MRMSDLRSDVCSSDLKLGPLLELSAAYQALAHHTVDHIEAVDAFIAKRRPVWADECRKLSLGRSEEHTSELQSLMRISYAVFCLKKKNTEEIRYTLWTTI